MRANPYSKIYHQVSQIVEKIPQCGNHMTMIDFINGCESGKFNDKNGIAYYATDCMMIGDKIITPRDALNKKINNNFFYVVWFSSNK